MKVLNNIGVLGCFYGCGAENARKVLQPWFNLKKELGITISVCHGQFKEYHDLGFPDNDEETLAALRDMEYRGEIDHLYIQNIPGTQEFKYEQEHVIRNHALQPIKEHNKVILLDSDEFYTEDQIKRIFTFVDDDNFKYYVWYSLYFKNYIGDGSEFTDFCPPRIFRNSQTHKIEEIYWDNDINYIEYYAGMIAPTINYKCLSNLQIPKSIAFIDHQSWTDDKAEKKIAYQEKHFGVGACGYKMIDGKVTKIK